MKQLIKQIDKLIKDIPQEIKDRVALETYYNDYDIETLLEFIKDVIINEKDYAKGRYV